MSWKQYPSLVYRESSSRSVRLAHGSVVVLPFPSTTIITLLAGVGGTDPDH